MEPWKDDRDEITRTLGSNCMDVEEETEFGSTMFVDDKAPY